MLNETQYNNLKYRRDRYQAAINNTSLFEKKLTDEQWREFERLADVDILISRSQERLLTEYEVMRNEPSDCVFPCVTYTESNEGEPEKVSPKCVVSFGPGMTILGHGRLGRKYLSISGETRRSICVVLNNGVAYVGVYYEGGDQSCSLTKVRQIYEG